MKQAVFSLALCTRATGALAATVTPTSYDMANGEKGSLTYYDDSYNVTGDTGVAKASLSGGTGDLTDSVIATANWWSTTGPYVGWRLTNPEITFNFDQSYAFT